jgi:phage-related protein
MLGGARAMAGLTAIAQATESDFNNLSEAIDGSSGTMVRTADGSVMHLTQALKEGKDVVAEYDGTAASMAGTMNDTANVQMKEFTNQLQSIAIQLGETLLPIVKEVVTQLSEWTARFKELTPEEQEVIVKTALVVAALGPLLSVGGRLISGIGTLLKLGPQVVKMMGTTAGSIALPIAAAAAFVAIIAVYGDQIQAILAEVDAYLQNVFATDWTKTFGTLGEPINYVLAQVRNFWNSFRTIFNGLIDFIRGVFTGDWDRAWKGIKEIFEGYFKMYVAIVKTPLNAVIGMINTVIGAFDQLGEKLNGYTFERPEWLGGGTWSFHVPTFNKIPYLAKGGILSEGSAIVGEAGPELLTMSNGRAVVQPLTNNTNNYAGATNNFYIQNNDPYAVAEQVSEILDHQTQQMAHAWS